MKVIFQHKKSNKDYWEILIDGEKWREVHRAIFGRKPSFPSISKDGLSSTFDELEYRRVKNYVLWRLSKQSYHSEQLARLLQERLVQNCTIGRVLQEYKEKGFLNDEAWLQSFMQSQQKRYSLRFILNKLRAKGLSLETIQQLAKEWNNPKEELHAIRHLLKTRYHLKDLTQYKTRQKVIVALMRKGYTFEQVQAALESAS